MQHTSAVLANEGPLVVRQSRDRSRGRRGGSGPAICPGSARPRPRLQACKLPAPHACKPMRAKTIWNIYHTVRAESWRVIRPVVTDSHGCRECKKRASARTPTDDLRPIVVGSPVTPRHWPPQPTKLFVDGDVMSNRRRKGTFTRSPASKTCQDRPSATPHANSGSRRCAHPCGC
jgi:hypothetical protein